MCTDDRKVIIDRDVDPETVDRAAVRVVADPILKLRSEPLAQRPSKPKNASSPTASTNSLCDRCSQAERVEKTSTVPPFADFSVSITTGSER